MGHIWGILGSVVTSGSRQDGRTPEILGKLAHSGKSRNLRVTYQIKALDALLHPYTLNYWNSRKILVKRSFVAVRATTSKFNAFSKQPLSYWQKCNSLNLLETKGLILFQSTCFLVKGFPLILRYED